MCLRVLRKAVQGRYCPSCGQERFKLRSPGVIQGFLEFFEDLTNVSVKAIMTITELFCLPGYLTRCYAKGKTARRLTPMNLYPTWFRHLYARHFHSSIVKKANVTTVATSAGHDTLTDWETKILSFTVALLMIALLRLLWGKRRENYPFALHASAALFLLTVTHDWLPDLVFLLLAVAWIFVGSVVTYRSYFAPWKPKSIEALLLKSTFTAVSLFVAFWISAVLLAFVKHPQVFLPRILQRFQ
jgi:hypothetical protein